MLRDTDDILHDRPRVLEDTGVDALEDEIAGRRPYAKRVVDVAGAVGGGGEDGDGKATGNGTGGALE